MPKKQLEQAIEAAAQKFALEIVAAVKASTLEELIALQTKDAPKRRGRKPGPKPGRKPGRKPGPKPKAEGTVKKKRVVKNYPKCAFPGCNNNRFPRGKGFCGVHWKEFEAGKIESADHYKNGGK